MNLLALETSTECCSVAVWHDAALIERSELAPRRHAELALPWAEELLAKAGLARSQLDAVAVGRGPGAFTGVRLGVSLAQGLALALDVPVLPISSLAALALQAPQEPGCTLAVTDARMGEVYAGAWQHEAAQLLRALDEERVCKPVDVRLPDGTQAWAAIGTGWGAYAAAITEAVGSGPAWAAPERYPQAGDVARLAALDLAAGGGVAPEQALPVYLRNKVARTAAERAAAKVGP